MSWSPLVEGLHLGQIVEITGNPTPGSDISSSTSCNGELGQLTDYMPDIDKFCVSMMSTGEDVRVTPKFVCTVSGCGGPGEGGDEDSFDIVLGPMTQKGPLGETLTSCLAGKGFCVAKVIQSVEDTAKSFDDLKELDAGGKLARLAQEVEEGYLGRSGRGKVMWLDPSNPSLPSTSAILRNDGNFTAIAEILQGTSEDSVGAAIAERTPALVCVSMTDADEADYESPTASDQMIEEFYSTWSRSVMRIIHFMGPGSGKAILTLKESAPRNDLEESTFEITATAGTLLVIREDMFEYMYEEPDEGEACWLTAFFMKEGVQWSMEDLEGDMKILGSVGSGPPPPDNGADNLVAVCAISIQAAGKMMDHHKEWCAYIAGCDGQLEMPFGRFDYRPYYSDEIDFPQGTTFVKHYSVQDGIELFDNRTFEISNAEAEGMDPQCRQVLETGYLSVFQLGLTKKYCNTNALHASVSVGCDKQEWLTLANVPRAVSTNQLAIVSNRFNYVFNLKGGSFSVDTACSSSLIGAHLGKVNMMERRWDPIEWHLGLGCGLTLTVWSFVGSCAQHMLSPGGRCFTFNATANGYNRGDGTACMLIKKGMCEEHRICYFRGSQIGQDGRSASMAAPNGPSQEKCVRGAIAEARMSAPESTVWECHGTGTSLGDPIEVGAVRKVQIRMKRLEPLMLASSKSNFGHLEGSAAALGMNKCIMTVIKITCAPTIHLKTLNAHLDHAAFDAIFINETNCYKYTQGHAQVSSFGVGGTNGHAIFWGEGYKPPPDFRAQFASKMAKAGSPIICGGRDPSMWEHKGLAHDAKPDDIYTVTYTVDDNGQTSIEYEKQVTTVTQPEYYSTTGTHNGWGEDRMIEGDIAGLFYQEVEVPESGQLEFRILADGEAEKCIGPETTSSKRTAKIVGPQADLKSSWVIEAPEGTSVRIEYFAAESAGGTQMRSITWFLIRDE
jgi:polyketide synthase-associated protein